jgi:hypothetical protein
VATVRIPRVTAVKVLEHYALRLTFDDGLTGDVDLSNLPAVGPVFEPLRDPDFFGKAYVDPRTRTIAWPGELDLDPEGLYAEARKHPVAHARRKRRRGTAGLKASGSTSGPLGVILRAASSSTKPGRPGHIR